MDLMKSSIMGKELIRHRKEFTKTERIHFSSQVRESGLGNVPIVVDSMDTELQEILDTRHTGMKGLRIIMHVDDRVYDLMKRIKIHLIEKGKDDLRLIQNLRLVLKKTLEVGEKDNFVDDFAIIGKLYNTYKEKDDNILYLILTKDQTLWSFLIRLLKSFFRQ